MKCGFTEVLTEGLFRGVRLTCTLEQHSNLIPHEDETLFKPKKEEVPNADVAVDAQSARS